MTRNLTTAEAAARLGIGTDTVLYHIRRGHLPGSHKMGRDWFVPLRAIEQFKPDPRGGGRWAAKRQRD